MACACGKGKGGIAIAPAPIFNLESSPLGESTSVYIQSKMQIVTQTFNRIFNPGVNVIIPNSYAQELVSLNAPVLIK